MGILTPQEAKDLMDTMPYGYQVAIAMCQITGIRPYEIPSIKWKNINADKKLIIIEGKQSKPPRNLKLTDIPDNLIVWIERYKTLSMGKAQSILIVCLPKKKAGVQGFWDSIFT